MAGSFLSARLTHRLGLDGVLGVGGAAVAAGGLAMTVAVALGFASAASLVLPMALYLAGLGMTLPQSIAGAMTPFPERAGAASSLLGFVQQSVAAISGACVGLLLGRDAWPLAGGVALAGCATLALWIATGAVRARLVKH
jgi:DHA1 family bicyclomycin/chloramphenicol resistance-like MFS transporter